MFHTIIIVGNLGRDPEMRYTPAGQAITTMNVATSRRYKNNNGEDVKETIWFRIKVWGKQGENCNQYLKKGSKVLVEGRLVPDPATGNPKIFTRQDGSSGTSFEVSATNIQFLSPKADDGTGYSGGQEDVAPAGGDEEIPF